MSHFSPFSPAPTPETGIGTPFATVEVQYKNKNFPEYPGIKTG